jgi:hypothetical protein
MRLIEEFDVQGALKIKDNVIVEPRFFGAYAIFGIQKKFIENETDELSTDFRAHLLHDPLLHPCAGPEAIDQYARWEPVEVFLQKLKLRLPSLPQLALTTDSPYLRNAGSRRAL